MTEHRYHVHARADAPPEVVFEVLADAPGWARWAPSVSCASYEREGEPPPHGVGAVRRLGPRRGPVSREEVVAYDPPRRYAYEIRSGPVPVKGYHAEVRLVPDRSGTRIEWTGRFETRVPGVAFALRRLVEGFARGLVAESEARAATV